MKKTKLVLLTALSALTLASCTLFSDKDTEIVNHFNAPEEISTIVHGEGKIGDIESIRVDGLDGISVFKSIGYGITSGENLIIPNSYKTGEYMTNKGNDYPFNKENNNYDLYVPDSLKKNEHHTVILFIHGGAWISGLKTHVNPYVKEFAKHNYIAATMEYTLLKKEMDDDSLSIFRNLDEIDACIASIKKSLTELGFTGGLDLMIGGVSSGAHISMLYAYSRGDKSELPIKFVVDAVGPTDIKPGAWKEFIESTDAVLDAGLSKAAIDAQKSASNIQNLEVSGQGYDWNDYQTMRIANGMCGLPFTLETVKAATDSNEKEIVDPSNPAAVSMTKANGGEDQLSVTYHINKGVNKYPMICAYAGKDSVVGIGQYANLEPVLGTNLIKHEYVYFRDCGHTNLSDDSTNYQILLNKVFEWLAASSI